MLHLSFFFAELCCLCGRKAGLRKEITVTLANLDRVLDGERAQLDKVEEDAVRVDVGLPALSISVLELVPMVCDERSLKLQNPCIFVTLSGSLTKS